MDSPRGPPAAAVATDAPADDLPTALAEADALAARSAADAARARLCAIEMLMGRIRGRGLDAAARRRLAACPWIMGPGWDALAVDGDATVLARESAGTAGRPDCGGRLALSPPCGGRLLIVEMMGPGRRLDWDYVDRCVRYMRMTKTALAAGGRPWECEGRIVADFIDGGGPLRDHLADLEGRGIVARRWPDLLVEAGAGWDLHLRMFAGQGCGAGADARDGGS